MTRNEKIKRIIAVLLDQPELSYQGLSLGSERQRLEAEDARDIAREILDALDG